MQQEDGENGCIRFVIISLLFLNEYLYWYIKGSCEI